MGDVERYKEAMDIARPGHAKITRVVSSEKAIVSEGFAFLHNDERVAEENGRRRELLSLGFKEEFLNMPRTPHHFVQIVDMGNDIGAYIIGNNHGGGPWDSIGDKHWLVKYDGSATLQPQIGMIFGDHFCIPKRGPLADALANEIAHDNEIGNISPQEMQDKICKIREALKGTQALEQFNIALAKSEKRFV